MRRIIINADDCGKSATVNSHIEKAIEAHKISSTTVMANMDDFEGALRLYKIYHDEISFGWHLNLTEGTPLLKSQLLLDYGYYKEENGMVIFNGLSFWKNQLPKNVKMEIIKELKAQYDKLVENGIIVSHMDSHQHIHTSPGLVGIVPVLCKELGLDRIRNIRNYVPLSINYMLRKAWGHYIRFKVKDCKMTQYFCSFQEYYNNPSLWNFNNIELMCHPGHGGDKYKSEEQLLLDSSLFKGIELINYNQL